MSTPLLSENVLPAFVGARVQALSDLIIQQGGALLASKGLKTNPRSVSIILALHTFGPMPLTHLAQRLDQPHQVTAQRLGYIEQANLVRRKADPTDARRRMLHLTAAGQAEATVLLTVLDETAQAFTNLFDEISCDVLASVNATISALETRSLTERIAALNSTT